MKCHSDRNHFAFYLSNLTEDQVDRRQGEEEEFKIQALEGQ